MRIEKICEYFNDIGILQLENINRFLKIYTQLSQNKYKNKSDKLILALFSYITLVSKNEQQLYDICKNIVNSFSNNQILYRYKALNIFNNIFKSKIHSKYILFFFKLNSFIFNKKRNIKYIHINKNTKAYNFNPKRKINENNEEDFTTNTSIGKNNSKISMEKKEKILNKKRLNNKKIKKSFDISDDEKECTFSPRINHYYKPYYKSNKNINMINNMKNIYNSEYNSSYQNSKENMNDNSFIKNIPFNNSVNYGYNNKINNEIEKLLINMSKSNNNPNNSKYLPKKTVYKKQINNLYPLNSYKEIPIYHYNNNEYENNEYNTDNNNAIYHYYDEEYDFYKKENDYIKKVKDKILELKLKKIDKLSKECTFSPEINKTPKYLNKNMNNYLTDYNISHRNYLRNNNNLINKTIERKIPKKDRINDEYAEDYYNIYPGKLSNNKKKRSRSYSETKNEYSIYKTRKEELSKLIQEKCPFMPNIKHNKNIEIKSTFDERQKKFIKDKEEMLKKKEEEELKKIKELQKQNNRSKTNSKEVVKRLYDKQAEKIKERLKKEKEEKSRKKIL